MKSTWDFDVEMPTLMMGTITTIDGESKDVEKEKEKISFGFRPPTKKEEDEKVRRNRKSRNSKRDSNSVSRTKSKSVSKRMGTKKRGSTGR